MSPSAAIRVRLFVISYAPLCAILAVTHVDEPWPPQSNLGFWLAGAAAGWGLVDAWRLPRGMFSKSHRTVVLSDIHDEGAAVAAYITSYLLPFLGLQLGEWRDGLALGIYLLVLLVVFLQTDLALVNPTLYLMGWKVASAAWNGRRVLILLPAERTIAEGTKIDVVSMDRFLIVDRSDEP